MGEPSGGAFWLTWTLGRLRGRKWEMTHTQDETQKLHLFKEGCGTWGCNFSSCFSVLPDGPFSLSTPPCPHSPPYIGMVFEPCPDPLAWVRVLSPQLQSMVAADGLQLPPSLKKGPRPLGASPPRKWRPSGRPIARD